MNGAISDSALPIKNSLNGPMVRILFALAIAIVPLRASLSWITSGVSENRSAETILVPARLKLPPKKRSWW